MDENSEKAQISEARQELLLALTKAPFNHPGTQEYEEARREVEAEIRPLIESSRRAERISAEELALPISPPGTRFGIGG